MLPQLSTILSLLSSATALSQILASDRSLLKRDESEKCMLRPHQIGESGAPQIISQSDFFLIYAAKLKSLGESVSQQSTGSNEQQLQETSVTQPMNNYPEETKAPAPSPPEPPKEPPQPTQQVPRPIAEPVTTVPHQAPPPEPKSDTNKVYGSGDADWNSECLSKHNDYRSAIPVPNLSWDESLAARAKERAEVNADLKQLVHDTYGNGENLYVTWGGDKACAAAVKAWYDEKPLFPSQGRFGDGDPSKYGHYTQVVWRSTTRVGCAYSDRGNSRYTVCQYAPAGNFVGQKPF